MSIKRIISRAFAVSDSVSNYAILQILNFRTSFPLSCRSFPPYPFVLLAQHGLCFRKMQWLPSVWGMTEMLG